MSKIKSISVGQLRGLYASPELLPPDAERSIKRKERFIIPDYQRGYRWACQLQVSALLEDILDFMLKTGNDRSKIYCLQPLVVTGSQLEQGSWEVIDGQQRLTTLYLLLQALEMKTFDLKYETRPKTAQFLQDLVLQDLEDHSNPDFHYISEAWKFIRDWVEKKMLKVPDFETKFKSILAENVSVIWYDVESEKRRENIEVFNRLNAGKIPLRSCLHKK